MRGGHYKRAIIGPPVKRHINGVSLACRCWPNIECWLGIFVVFQGFRTSIGRKPYISWLFRGGPDPLLMHLLDPRMWSGSLLNTWVILLVPSCAGWFLWPDTTGTIMANVYTVNLNFQRLIDFSRWSEWFRMVLKHVFNYRKFAMSFLFAFNRPAGNPGFQ